MKVFNKDFGYGHVVRGSVKNQRYDINSHIHQFSEMIYVFSGEINLTVDGNEFRMQAGDFAVITPFQIHELHTVGEAEFWMCVFSNDAVPNHTTEPELFYRRESSVFQASELLRMQISDIIARVEHPIRINGDLAPRSVRSALYLAFSEYAEKVAAAETGKRKNVLAEIFLYLNEHYLEEDISIKSVGKALGYNPKYLSQCINAIPELSFCTLLNSLRIDKAKNLLLSTDYTVTKIAFECGFENEQSFYRTFSRIVGATPRKYRMGLK